MAKLTYKRSGVDIEKGDLISKNAFNQLKKTLLPNSFNLHSLIALDASFKDYKKPYLAFAADGVGTKLLYTFKHNQNRTVGIDLVAMCVNDLVRNNITPLGFALYRATGQIDELTMASVAEGVTNACLEANCVYVTGESAEMPDFYQKGEYDLAGFAVGVFEKEKLISGRDIKAGDIIFGLASSGLHSNGFSLVRRVFPPEKINRDSRLHQEIVAPTKIYVKGVLETNKKFKINGWAHITGGGLFGKLGKILPSNLNAKLEKNGWEIPNIFQEIQQKGRLAEPEMYSTFNMGIGFAGVVSEKLISRVVDFLKEKGEEAFIIGQVVESKSQKRVFFDRLA